MNELVKEIIADKSVFSDLEIDEQLAVIADLILYFAQLKIAALKAAGKTRTDSCIEAQEFEAYENYWKHVQMNVKKVIELETEKLRRGL